MDDVEIDIYKYLKLSPTCKLSDLILTYVDKDREIQKYIDECQKWLYEVEQISENFLKMDEVQKKIQTAKKFKWDLRVAYETEINFGRDAYRNGTSQQPDTSNYQVATLQDNAQQRVSRTGKELKAPNLSKQKRIGRLKNRYIPLVLAAFIGLHGLTTHWSDIFPKTNADIPATVATQVQEETKKPEWQIKLEAEQAKRKELFANREKSISEIYSGLSDESEVKKAISAAMGTYSGTYSGASSPSNEYVEKMLKEDFYTKSGYNLEGELYFYTLLLEGLAKGMVADAIKADYKEVSFKCTKETIFVFLKGDQKNPIAKTTKKVNNDGTIRYTGSSSYTDIGHQLGSMIDAFTKGKEPFYSWNNSPLLIEYQNREQASGTCSEIKRMVESLFKQMEQGYSLDYSNGVLGGSMSLQTENTYDPSARNTGIDR